MRAIKNLNNNVALCVDGKNREVIAFGKGIGFNKVPNDIPLSRIDRTFYNVSPTFVSVIPEIDETVLRTAVEIVDYANTVKDNRYAPNLIFALADHIQFAVTRAKKGMRISIGLLYEIESMYPDEIEIARAALKMIQKRMGVALGREETASIAIHLIDYVNSGKEPDVPDEAELIEAYTCMIEKQLGRTIDRNGYNYTRFATHVHYLLQRIAKNEPASSGTPEFLKTLKDDYADEYACAKLLEEKIRRPLSEEELAYLILHISRLNNSGE